MTDNEIRNYIEGLEQPLVLSDIMSELRESDPSLSFKRVTRIMRELGFENKVCKNAKNPQGKGSAWFRTGNAVATCVDDEVEEEDDYEDAEDDYEDDEDDEVEEDGYEDDDDDAEDDGEVDEDDEDGVSDSEKTEETKDTKARTRSTADALREVSAKNDEDSDLLKRLLMGLTRSRSLKEELMKRQQEMMLELARRILGLYGSEKERKTYGDF